MSQREEMQSLIELKRALERDMGIAIDMNRFGVKQRLLRLAQASENPEITTLARRLDAPEEAPAQTEGKRVRGYYRGRPIYED